MKTNEKLNSNDFKESFGNDHHQILIHILSPLELEAYKRSYQSFEYLLNGIKIPITEDVCQQLLNLSVLKVKIFTSVLNKNIFFLINDSAKLQLFLVSPITSHKISTHLRHRLQGLGCQTMLHVIELGKDHILHSRGIGKVAMNELMTLLKNHGCDLLFF